jgi:hypothetical protein
MVERLNSLLHDEAAGIDVPVPPAAAILRRGRNQRRRRRLIEGVAGIATVGLVAAGAGTMVDRGSGGKPSAQERFASASAAVAYDGYGAFSAGSTVYIGNHRVKLPEKVKALYYTSLGVLVRTGDVAETDASGPSHYTLVHPDGTTKDIDLRMRDRVVGTDPDSPNVAYAEPREGRHGSKWDFVVVDLETGQETARTTVGDARFTWGGWEAPPVDLAGSRMWALVDDGWMEYDWSTGKTRMIPGTEGDRLVVAHGRYAEEAGAGWTIKDFVTGETVRRITADTDLWFDFSPDGRYVSLIDFMDRDDPDPVRFVNVETGASTTQPWGGEIRYGWTPDGRVLSVDPEQDRLTVCDPDTGECAMIDLEVGSGEVKLGGLSNES